MENIIHGKEVKNLMRKKEKTDKKARTSLPAQAMMEIRDVLDVKSSTGEVRLTDEAVEKGKEWTEFTKL